MRSLSKKFYKFSRDQYTGNFIKQQSDEVTIDVRQPQDVTILDKAIKYCDIINHQDRLNCDIYFEWPDTRTPQYT